MPTATCTRERYVGGARMMSVWQPSRPSVAAFEPHPESEERGQFCCNPGTKSESAPVLHLLPMYATIHM